MFEMLINLIFWFVKTIYSISFGPIISFITDIFPDLSTLIDNIKNFLSIYVFNTLQWTKMFLMNATAFPQALFTFLSTVFFIMVSIHFTLTIYEGAIRIYNTFKP